MVGTVVVHIHTLLLRRQDYELRIKAHFREIFVKLLVI